MSCLLRTCPGCWRIGCQTRTVFHNPRWTPLTRRGRGRHARIFCVSPRLVGAESSFCVKLEKVSVGVEWRRLRNYFMNGREYSSMKGGELVSLAWHDRVHLGEQGINLLPALGTKRCSLNLNQRWCGWACPQGASGQRLTKLSGDNPSTENSQCLWKMWHNFQSRVHVFQSPTNHSSTNV